MSVATLLPRSRQAGGRQAGSRSMGGATGAALASGPGMMVSSRPRSGVAGVGSAVADQLVICAAGQRSSMGLDGSAVIFRSAQ